MEVILKEFKDSNESGGESTMNFTRIIITNYHPLRIFQPQKCKRDEKKKFCYYCDEKYESGYKYKMRQFFQLNGHKSEGKATSKVKNDIKRMILWF